jgi:ProP effector
MDSDVPSPAQSARLLLKQLEQNYPVFRNAVPLAVGIDKSIIARMPDINRKVLRIALGMHTRSVRYLKVMENSQTRFDLDGNLAGEVPESHRLHASQMRRERVAKAQQQQKEKQRVEREQALHQAKLQQLTEKFSPRR